MIQFTDHSQGNAKVVAAKGRLDATTAHLLEVHCGDLLRSGCKCVVFDFRELAVLSSAGLRAILGLSKRIHAGGGKLVLLACAVPSAICSTSPASWTPSPWWTRWNRTSPRTHQTHS